MNYNPLDSYGYETGGQKIISQKTQEEQKQSFVNEEQDVEIQRISDDNATQQMEINRNTEVNDQQSVQINELYELIESIPGSGGTITEIDCGNW